MIEGLLTSLEGMPALWQTPSSTELLITVTASTPKVLMLNMTYPCVNYTVFFTAHFPYPNSSSIIIIIRLYLYPLIYFLYTESNTHAVFSIRHLILYNQSQYNFDLQHLHYNFYHSNHKD